MTAAANAPYEAPELGPAVHDDANTLRTDSSPQGGNSRSHRQGDSGFVTIERPFAKVSPEWAGAMPPEPAASPILKALGCQGQTWPDICESTLLLNNDAQPEFQGDPRMEEPPIIFGGASTRGEAMSRR